MNLGRKLRNIYPEEGYILFDLLIALIMVIGLFAPFFLEYIYGMTELFTIPTIYLFPLSTFLLLLLMMEVYSYNYSLKTIQVYENGLKIGNFYGEFKDIEIKREARKIVFYNGDASFVLKNIFDEKSIGQLEDLLKK